MIPHPTALNNQSPPSSVMSSVRLLNGMSAWGLWGVLASLVGLMNPLLGRYVPD